MNSAAAARATPLTNVELQRKGKVATVHFTRDDGPVLFCSPTLGELGRIVGQLAEDSSVRFVVFRGSGSVFSAGADITEVGHITEDQGYSLSKHGQHVFDAIENLPQITFAAMNGHALGGGCELALACSFRLMVAGAKIGQPEVKLGLIPGWGATKRLPMIVPLAWALRMLYSGEPITAEQAERIGLVDEVVPTAEGLDAALERWFKMFEQGAPQAIIRIKRAILNDNEAHQFGLCFSCADSKEGMQAFLEKREAPWVSGEDGNEGSRQ
ncbi:MAG: enoyl-CoA hydratase/isomerase family protein [Phycisphaerae bacterium]